MSNGGVLLPDITSRHLQAFKTYHTHHTRFQAVVLKVPKVFFLEIRSGESKITKFQKS